MSDKEKLLAQALFDFWAEDTETAMDTSHAQHPRGTPKSMMAARAVARWYEMFRTPFAKLSDQDRAAFENRARTLLELLGAPSVSHTGMSDPRIANREGKIVIERKGRRRVLHPFQGVEDGDVFIADRPHADGRYDYLCGGSWCRCTQ